MSHPGDELQAAIYAALNDNAGVKAAMGGAARIYDRVPTSPVFPYVTIGEEQMVDDSNSCDPDGFECYFDVHVWTEEYGLPQGKRIAGAVRGAILSGLAITGWLPKVLTYETERHFRDADGIRGHGVMTFKTKLETA